MSIDTANERRIAALTLPITHEPIPDNLPDAYGRAHVVWVVGLHLVLTADTNLHADYRPVSLHSQTRETSLHSYIKPTSLHSQTREVALHSHRRPTTLHSGERP